MTVAATRLKSIGTATVAIVLRNRLGLVAGAACLDGLHASGWQVNQSRSSMTAELDASTEGSRVTA
jgi:hypothetical protein